MSILGTIFSGGAKDLVEGVGGVIDDLHTSEEEKLEANQKIKELVANYQIEMEKNIHKSTTNNAREYTKGCLCGYRNTI